MHTFVSIAEAARFDPAKLAKNNLFTTDRFFCDVYCLLPGQAQRPHIHADSDKIYVVLEGEAQVEVNGATRVLRPQEAALCRPGESHAIANVSEAPVKVLVFMTPRPA
jgi:mannose-6-phosphate isomerase-like protein (cupin superfamily)